MLMNGSSDDRLGRRRACERGRRAGASSAVGVQQGRELEVVASTHREAADELLDSALPEPRRSSLC